MSNISVNSRITYWLTHPLGVLVVTVFIVLLVTMDVLQAVFFCGTFIGIVILPMYATYKMSKQNAPVTSIVGSLSIAIMIILSRIQELPESAMLGLWSSLICGVLVFFLSSSIKISGHGVVLAGCIIVSLLVSPQIAWIVYLFAVFSGWNVIRDGRAELQDMIQGGIVAFFAFIFTNVFFAM